MLRTQWFGCGVFKSLLSVYYSLLRILRLVFCVDAINNDNSIFIWGKPSKQTKEVNESRAINAINANTQSRQFRFLPTLLLCFVTLQRWLKSHRMISIAIWCVRRFRHEEFIRRDGGEGADWNAGIKDVITCRCLHLITKHYLFLSPLFKLPLLSSSIQRKTHNNLRDNDINRFVLHINCNRSGCFSWFVWFVECFLCKFPFIFPTNLNFN